MKVRLFVPPEWIMEEGFQLPPGAQPWPSGVPRSASRKTMGSSSSSSGSGNTARGGSASVSGSGSGKTDRTSARPAARTSLDEALSSSSYRGGSGEGDKSGDKGTSGPSQMDVGMTPDMQQDVQSKLFGVFGGIRGDGGGGGGDRGRSQGEEGDGWAWPCIVCTLINAGEDDFCVACDTPRE